jgi:hypothetical protein
LIRWNNEARSADCGFVILDILDAIEAIREASETGVSGFNLFRKREVNASARCVEKCNGSSLAQAVLSNWVSPRFSHSSPNHGTSTSTAALMQHGSLEGRG